VQVIVCALMQSSVNYNLLCTVKLVCCSYAAATYVLLGCCFQVRISCGDGSSGQQWPNEEHRSWVCVGLWGRRVLGLQSLLPSGYACGRGLSTHRVGQSRSPLPGPTADVLPEMSWSAVVRLFSLLMYTQLAMPAFCAKMLKILHV